MKFTLPRLAENKTEFSQIWAAKIMPNLVTVKLYLQIKVIPLSMSYAEHKSLCQLLSFKRKKRNPLNFTCLNSHCIEHIWPMAKQILNSIISETTKSYLVGNGSWSPISMLDLRPNKQTNKQTWKKSTKWSPIQHWILNWRRRRKKLVKLKWKSKNKKCRKLLID